MWARHGAKSVGGYNAYSKGDPLGGQDPIGLARCEPCVQSNTGIATVGTATWGPIEWKIATTLDYTDLVVRVNGQCPGNEICGLDSTQSVYNRHNLQVYLLYRNGNTGAWKPWAVGDGIDQIAYEDGCLRWHADKSCGGTATPTWIVFPRPNTGEGDYGKMNGRSHANIPGYKLFAPCGGVTTQRYRVLGDLNMDYNANIPMHITLTCSTCSSSGGSCPP